MGLAIWGAPLGFVLFLCLALRNRRLSGVLRPVLMGAHCCHVDNDPFFCFVAFVGNLLPRRGVLALLRPVPFSVSPFYIAYYCFDGQKTVGAGLGFALHMRPQVHHPQ